MLIPVKKNQPIPKLHQAKAQHQQQNHIKNHCQLRRELSQVILLIKLVKEMNLMIMKKTMVIKGIKN